MEIGLFYLLRLPYQLLLVAFLVLREVQIGFKPCKQLFLKRRTAVKLAAYFPPPIVLQITGPGADAAAMARMQHPVAETVLEAAAAQELFPVPCRTISCLQSAEALQMRHISAFMDGMPFSRMVQRVHERLEKFLPLPAQMGVFLHFRRQLL